MGNKQTGFTTYLSEEEKMQIWQKLGEMGPPISMAKISRALLLLWSRGEIELTRDEVLDMCPDGRLTRWQET